MKTERVFEFDFQERGCSIITTGPPSRPGGCGLKVKYVPNLIPHDYMCPCEACIAMTAAITAQNPDGSYFFTEEELKQMAIVSAERARA